jgi:hypothetical protein
MFVSVVATPFSHNSLHHRDGINYKLSYPLNAFNLRNAGDYTKGTSGKLAVIVSSSNLANVVIGDSVEITTGKHIGRYQVTRILTKGTITSVIQVDRNFIENETANVRVFYRAVIQIWSGLSTQTRPNKLTATIAATANPFDSYFANVNVAEYLKKDFPINHPKQGVDFGLMTDVWLRQTIGSNSVALGIKYRVVNSAISSQELLTYVGDGKILDSQKPRLFNCGPSVYSMITGLGVGGHTVDVTEPPPSPAEPFPSTDDDKLLADDESKVFSAL